jgi:uncharacterized protein (TIGR02996 family)
MSVYFTYRRHNLGPSGKYTRRFDDDTVFDWFRNRWRHVPDINEVKTTWWQDTFGCPSVYGLGSLFEAIGEHSLPVPQSPQQLAAYLRRHLYVEGTMLSSLPHCLQVLTDDDELQLAYYFYDDHYLKQHRGQAAFLRHDDWRLPVDWGSGGFTTKERTTLLTPQRRGQGMTFLAISSYYETHNLSDPTPPQAFRLKGVRLPELGRFLVASDPEDWPLPIYYLRAAFLAPPPQVTPTEAGFLQTLREQPEDGAAWGAYADWLAEQGQGSLGRHLLLRACERATRYTFKLLEELEEWSEVLGSRRDLDGGLEWDLGTLVAAEKGELFSKKDKVQGRLRDGPGGSQLQVDEHVAHLCLQVGKCLWTGRDSFFQWLLFDDLWASAHAELANAILRYVRRWDVLTARGKPAPG